MREGSVKAAAFAFVDDVDSDTSFCITDEAYFSTTLTDRRMTCSNTILNQMEGFSFSMPASIDLKKIQLLTKKNQEKLPNFFPE